MLKNKAVLEAALFWVMAPGTLKWHSCPLLSGHLCLVCFATDSSFGSIFFSTPLSRLPPFQSHLYALIIISQLKSTSKVWDLSPASAQCCGQCEILHSLHTHSHSGEKNKQRRQTPGCWKTKTKQKSHVSGYKLQVLRCHFQTIKSTSIFFFFFLLWALSYLQTRPQIWSSNFTVLALALETNEDTEVKSHMLQN